LGDCPPAQDCVLTLGTSSWLSTSPGVCPDPGGQGGHALGFSSSRESRQHDIKEEMDWSNSSVEQR
jgi:hypothetical protein